MARYCLAMKMGKVRPIAVGVIADLERGFDFHITVDMNLEHFLAHKDSRTLIASTTTREMKSMWKH
jgi:hypothetical protein